MGHQVKLQLRRCNKYVQVGGRKTFWSLSLNFNCLSNLRSINGAAAPMNAGIVSSRAENHGLDGQWHGRGTFRCGWTVSLVDRRPLLPS